MKTNNSASIVERMVIPHTAFAEARQRIEQCFAFSATWFDATVQEQLKPFERGFRPEATVDALDRAGRIGTVADLPEKPRRPRVGIRKAESINAALVAA